MKKIISQLTARRSFIILILSSLFLYSCNKKSNIDYAIISGKITNNSEKVSLDIDGISFLKTIELDEQGAFIDTIKITKDIYHYTLANGKYGTRIYLSKGCKTHITYDANNYQNTLSFEGDGADINQYIFKKNIISKQNFRESWDIYRNDEKTFATAMQLLKSKKDSLLSSLNLPKDYKQMEHNAIDYAYTLSMSYYKSLHTYLTKDISFETSEEFKSKYTPLVDFERGLYYKNYYAYRILVARGLEKKISELMETNTTLSRIDAYFQIVGDIKNDYIRNHLLLKETEKSLVDSKNPKALYEKFKANYTGDKDATKKIESIYKNMEPLFRGVPSPEFNNYVNYAGGLTSLKDFRGKYVYIDLWATWCGPCKQQIPYLKKIEKKYHGKNIEFVSISIDKISDQDTWKNMIKEKKLGGVQLFADNAWKSKFISDYLVMGIPRFILIDPEGNIVSANAPRPSDKKLIELFDEVNI